MAEDAFEVQITDYIKSLLLDSKSKFWISATELTAEDNHANRQNKELKNPNSISFLILPIPNSIYAIFFFLSYPVGSLSCLHWLIDFREGTVF